MPRKKQEAVTYLSGPNGVTEKIRQAMRNVCKEYVYIGFLLWEVKEYEYFREGGYADVYDYAQAELGFKRRSVANFIAIMNEFGSKDKHGVPTLSLKDEYEDFNYSQLCEMLALSDHDRQEVKKTMSIRDIRAMKRREAVQTSGQDQEQLSFSDAKTIHISIAEPSLKLLQTYANEEGRDLDRIIEDALDLYFKTRILNQAI